jgi:putrescine transport system permease protein
VKGLDRSIEEAALDLGARPLKVFFVITLPLIAQALVSGWLLAFTVSIDDVILSAFLSGPGSTTLPLVVFSRVRLGLNPEMNALATVFITVVTIGVVVVNRSMLARERRQARDARAWHAACAPDAPSAPMASPPARTSTVHARRDPAPHPVK